MIERISQSFIKSYREYLAGEECGNIIKHQYVDGHLIDRQSDSMAEGSYFEFRLSGGLPKNQIPPVPEYTKTAMKNKAASSLTVADMTMEYKRAEFNAAFVKGLLKRMKLKIVHVSKKLVKGRYDGVIDLICEVEEDVVFSDGKQWKKGDRIVLDIKYSGLLHDEWSKHGWAFKKDIQKSYHGTQAKQYHYVSSLPFYFLVVSNTNKEIDGQFENPEVKLLYVPIDEHMVEQHLIESNALFEKFQFEAEMGLTPRPSMFRCGKCPIKDSCQDKHDIPHPVEVDLTMGV